MISVSVTELQDLVVPAGTVVAGLRFMASHTVSADPVIVDVEGNFEVGASAELFVADAGDYIVSVQAFDANDNLLGVPVVAHVNVPGPTTITVKVPSAISAVVA